MEPLTDEQIIVLKSALLDLQEELTTTLGRSASAAQPVTLDQQAVGRVSRIDAIQQQQMVEANRRRIKIRLQQIKVALAAINNEEYGYCRRCEEDIGFGRLHAKPESAICVDCQGEIEARA